MAIVSFGSQMSAQQWDPPANNDLSHIIEILTMDNNDKNASQTIGEK